MKCLNGAGQKAKEETKKVKDYKGRKRLRRKEGTKKGMMERKDNHNRGGARGLNFVLCQ